VKSSFEFKNSISSTRNCNEFRFFEPRFTSLPANSIVVCHVCSRLPALAGHSRTCTVQSRHNSAQVSATQGPAVPDCVMSALDIASRQRLRSASRHQLLVPRYRLSSLGCQSFAVSGPTTWNNSLSADLRDPTCSDESFRRSLKTFLFAKY